MPLRARKIVAQSAIKKHAIKVVVTISKSRPSAAFAVIAVVTGDYLGLPWFTLNFNFSTGQE